MGPIVIKLVVIYVFLMSAFRLVGKRELSTLSPFELVTVILIPEIASESLVGSGSVVEALVGISTLFMLVLILSSLTHRFTWAAKLVEAEATILVSHGKLCEDTMHRERISPGELFGELHKRGFADLSQIRWAILESGGEISFIPEQDEKRDTRKLAADYQPPRRRV